MAQEFQPNNLTFEQGLERIRNACDKSGLNQKSAIITSRDTKANEAQRLLKVSNIPNGFTKWQLPVYLSNPSQLFLTIAQPEAMAEEHSHDEGDGIRFITSGSIIYKNVELTAGDWMFIPKGQKYSFVTGRMGAMMCYCYCCCCA
jgi:hypothetical protein